MADLSDDYLIIDQAISEMNHNLKQFISIEISNIKDFVSRLYYLWVVF